MAIKDTKDTKIETRVAEDLHNTYKIAKTVGVAIMASLFVYAIVVEYIKRQYEPFNGFAPLPHQTFGMLRYVLLGAAGAEFFIIHFLDRALLSAKIPVGTPPSQRLMIAAVVRFALCESVAIYGLVLFLIQGSSMDFYSFLIISLFYFGIYFPRYDAWEAWVKEREKPADRR